MTGLAWRTEDKTIPSFRIRNKHSKTGRTKIRVGDNDSPRSVTLSGIGAIRVRADTRRLRRLLTKDRARILYATVSYRAARWWISLTCEAPIFARVTVNAGQTQDRLVIEDLHVAGMVRNRRLARAISDAGWADFARMLTYKQAWRGGVITIADRWFPSSKRCSACTTIHSTLTLADRVFFCECGFRGDRDHNAAVNLAQWPLIRQDFSRSPDPRAGGRVTKVRRQIGSDRHSVSVGETSLVDAETEARTT